MITIGRPKKEIEKRISGTGYKKGSIGYNLLKYKTLNKQTGLYDIDHQSIKMIVDRYTDRLRREITKEKTDSKGLITLETITTPISRAGLRLALDISRDTYAAWLNGFTCHDEYDKEDVQANIDLRNAMRAGDDKIIQELIENGDKYSTTKDIRLLETYGEIAPQKQQIDAKIGIQDLGKWKKYSK